MDLYKMTALEAHKALKDKEISALELTQSVIDRIDSIDDKVCAYITKTYEKAVECAKKVDKKIAANNKIAPLEGIPMAIMDNICIQGVKTTCASKMLADFVPPYSAFAYKKLANINSPMLGKLNMDEFTAGVSCENSYFKKTKNPYDLEKVPGGASGGCAAAVAADMAVFAIGSDSGGDIRQPASYSGVVGFKPTYGMVSRYGLVSYASSMEQIGVIAKNVSDTALALGTIVGYDKMDSTSVNTEALDYTKYLVKDIKGLRIGILLENMDQGMDDDVKDAVLKAADIFKDCGAEVEKISISSLEYALPTHYIISSAEASSNLGRYDGVRYGYRTQNYENLTDLYKNTRREGFGCEVKRRIMFGTYALSSGYYDKYYNKAQKVRTIIRNEFDKVFEKYDIILTPTTPTTAFKIGEKISDPLAMQKSNIYTVCANMMGIPAISLPVGYNKDKMPIGMQLMGRAFGESTLIRAGYTFEKSANIIKKRPII